MTNTAEESQHAKLGIDYGTTTTLVSYTRYFGNRSTSKLIDIGGDRLGYMRSSIPSAIALTRDGRIEIGYEAEKIAENGIKAIKGNIDHRPDIGTKELIEKRIKHMESLRNK